MCDRGRGAGERERERNERYHANERTKEEGGEDILLLRTKETEKGGAMIGGRSNSFFSVSKRATFET